MPVLQPSIRQRISRELALLGGFVLAGLALLPLAVYFVGRAIFGDYGSGGFAAFYGTLHSQFRDGQPAVLFLLLSPCIIWLLLRLTFYAFGRGATDRPGAPAEEGVSGTGSSPPPP